MRSRTYRSQATKRRSGCCPTIHKWSFCVLRSNICRQNTLLYAFACNHNRNVFHERKKVQSITIAHSTKATHIDASRVHGFHIVLLLLHSKQMSLMSCVTFPSRVYVCVCVCVAPGANGHAACSELPGQTTVLHGGIDWRDLSLMIALSIKTRHGLNLFDDIHMNGTMCAHDCVVP
jgi:hypothetical protein